MEDDRLRIFELSQQGFCCSQILLMMGLEAQGKENPDLIRAMAGLCGGGGYSGKNCGAFTGGLCLLSMYVGRGTLEEMEVLFASRMMAQLVEWFEDEIGSKYGGVNCIQILEENPLNKMERCPDLIQLVFEKVEAILEEQGHSLSKGARVED